MKRVRITKPIRPRERWWLDGLPIDPRDPDVLRAKALGRARVEEARTSARSTRVTDEGERCAARA